MYRALERLQEEILVLHGFKYTHHQYRLCDQNRKKKSCGICKNAANRDGECDFLIIGKNYFVIIEVKNIPHDKDEDITQTKRREVHGALKKSRKQSDKIKSLIESLSRAVGAEYRSTILHFSAFPSSHRILFKGMDEIDKTRIICKEDILDFSGWWLTNVKGQITGSSSDASVTNHREVKEILVAIFCTDKNRCDELKCSLVKSMKDIDLELNKGRIMFRSKNRLPNPNVIRAADIETAIIDGDTNIFRDIIGIENLTAEQLDAFNRNHSLLIINGPAGTGKTIILLAKIIQLIRYHEENRVVLLIFRKRYFYDNNPHNTSYQDILQKADISRSVMERDLKESGDETVEKILASLKENRVVIVGMGLGKSNSLEDVLSEQLAGSAHIFIDDCQAELYKRDTNTQLLLNRLKELSLTNWAWIACDLNQISYTSRRELGEETVWAYTPENDMPPENIATLSLNLRNSSDIAVILSAIRGRLVEEILEGRAENIDALLPELQPGHLIHGPRTVVHFIDQKLDKNDTELIDTILKKELDKLCDPEVSGGLKIGIIRDSYRIIVDKTIHRAIKSRSNMTIESCHVDNCYSSEYPAVIVVNEVRTRGASISSLFLEISRARVYCAVILYSTSSSYDTLSEYQPLINLLDTLEDSVRVIRY